MDIQTRKLNFIESFLLLQNDSVLTKLETILKSAARNPISIAKNGYDKELEQANERIENGDFFTAAEVINIVSQWKK
jgi:hypothetical protein